ncbi:MAG: hypothetical protein QN157_02835 [Armatimonadota bacterium]|nr:hypothetical protein [Armatimonadota bacterium]
MQPADDAIDPRLAAVLAGLRIDVDPREFAVVRVAAAYGPSLRLALASLLAPFFVQVGGREVRAVLAADEWAKVAHRFPRAQVEAGYRLMVLDAHRDPTGPDYLPAVAAALTRAGIQAQVLPSFHHEHLLVRATQVGQVGEVLRDLVAAARETSCDRPS